MNTKTLPQIASDIRACIEEGVDRPPVQDWQPEHIGSIDIRISANGRWYYQQEPMERESLVRLFSSILRLDDDGHCLVTPVEKMLIQVDDAPFIITMINVIDREGEKVVEMATNVGDCFELSPEHPLVLEENDSGESSLYVAVRYGLLARLSRPVYYEMAEHAKEQCEAEESSFWVESGGHWFQMA